MASATGSARERIRWVDAGRGASMVLVTVFHATFIVDGALGAGSGIWPELNAAILPVRMPLFFFISGLLAAEAVKKPLAETRRRTLGLVYLYILWSLLQLVHLLYSLRGRGDPFPEAYDVVVALFVPTGLWFFWALAAYFLVSRLLVKWLGSRSALAGVPLLALAIAAPLVDEFVAVGVDDHFGDVFFGAVCANFIWFHLGIHTRERALRLAAASNWVLAAGAVVAYVALYLSARTAGLTHETRWLLSAVALVAAILLLGLASYRGPIGRALTAVGQRTLAIYATQWLAMHLLAKAIIEYPLLEGVGDPDIVASIATPLFALLIVAATWWAGGVILRSPFAWLLAAPRWVVGESPPQPAPRGGSRPRQRVRR